MLVLYDNDTIIWDSLAIVEYLFEKHDSVWPIDRRARAWARSAAAEMHSSFEALRTQCQMNCSVEVKLNEVPENLKKDIDRIDELFESGLDKSVGLIFRVTNLLLLMHFSAPLHLEFGHITYL